MTRLSVNINKIALLRNSRGGRIPDVIQFAKDCERFGAEGITVHPRPDKRHIRYQDVYDLKPIVSTEFNIEGYPSDKFLKMVLEVKPDQCTLVPDSPEVLTSNSGWDTVKNQDILQDVIKSLKDAGIRVSLFIDPISNQIEGAAKVSADRIEYYTGPYAHHYQTDKNEAVKLYRETSETARSVGLGINAGHDLDLKNLRYFNKEVSDLLEVSIGHALVKDCLYYGLENTIQLYLKELGI